MAGTQVLQVRKPTKIEGTNKYAVTTTCIVAGDLPDRHIFLLTINQVKDPKNDTLVRVSSIADFSEFKADREEALNAGDSRWRASSITLNYDDIETANAAWKELSSRINTLVEQFDAFSEEFETVSSGETITFPTVDLSTIEDLKTAYRNTLKPFEEAKKERDEHQKSCADLEDDLETIEERLQEAQTDLSSYLTVQSSLSSNNNILQSVKSDIEVAKDSIRTTNSGSSATSSEQDSIETQLRNIEAELNQFTSANASLGSLHSGEISTVVSTLQTRVATLSSEKNKTLVSLNKCNTKLSQLEGKVDAAREARDAALAAVLDVCPEFEPES